MAATNLLLRVNTNLLKVSGVWDGFIKHVLKLMTKKWKRNSRAGCLWWIWVDLAENLMPAGTYSVGTLLLCNTSSQRRWFFISTRLVSCLKLSGKRYFSLSCRTEGKKTDNFLNTPKLWWIYVVFHYASSEKSPLEIRISGKIVWGSSTTSSS